MTRSFPSLTSGTALLAAYFLPFCPSKTASGKGTASMRLRAMVAVWMVAFAASAADRGEWKATLASAVRSLDAGQCREAEPLVQRALQQAGEFGSNDTAVAYTLRAVGTLESCLGNFQQAEQSYRKALRILTPVDGHRLAVSRLHSDLGSLYMTMGGHLTEAEKAFRSEIEILASIPGPAQAQDTADGLVSLAGIMLERGAPEEARDLLYRALVIAEKAPGAPRAAAAALNGLGGVASEEGRTEEALAYFMHSTEVWRQTDHNRHPDIIPSLLNSGILYLKLHRPIESLAVLREAQEIAEATLGDAHPLLGQVLFARAEALSKTGERRESRELKRRSERIRNQHPAGSASISITDLIQGSSRR